MSSSEPMAEVEPTVVMTPILTAAIATTVPGEEILAPVSVDEANLQVLATVQRWTSTQLLGVDCMAAVCNHEIALSLTLLTPEVVQDLVQQELAGRNDVTQNEFDQRLQEINRRLNVEEQLPFMLVVSTPQEPTLPVRSQIFMGEIQSELILQTNDQQSFLPIAADPALNLPFASFLEEPLKGHVFYPNQNQVGQLILSDQTTSLTVQLAMNEELNSDRTVVSWSFDLVAAHHPPPLTPTPTPDPNAPTPTADDGFAVDPELVVEVVTVLAEVYFRTH